MYRLYCTVLYIQVWQPAVACQLQKAAGRKEIAQGLSREKNIGSEPYAIKCAKSTKSYVNIFLKF